MADISKITLPNGEEYDLKDTLARESIPTKVSELENDARYMSGMTILSYGSSTWADFIAAYGDNKVVYCRASSGSNPASGSQTRLAFMAYVNNAATPTEVEFQYYRSVNAHTDAQQGDQVYVYKLNKNSGWTVTVRNAFSKIATGAGLTHTYSNGTITIESEGEVYRELPIYVNGSLNYQDPPTGTLSADSIGSMANLRANLHAYILYGDGGIACPGKVERYRLSFIDVESRYYEDYGDQAPYIIAHFRTISVRNGTPLLKEFIVEGFEDVDTSNATVTYSEVSLGLAPSATGVSF